MKLQEITNIDEMTMRTPANAFEDMSKELPFFQTLKETGEHCGDIEHTQIYKKSRKSLIDYAFFQQEQCVGFAVLNGNVVTNLYVTPQVRKTGIGSLFLFFLKRNEGISKLVLHDVHSEQTVDFIKRIYKRFDTNWVKGNEKIPYDPNTINQFYSIERPTGWSITLENDGDFSKWEKFWINENNKNGGPPDIHSIYQWLLN